MNFEIFSTLPCRLNAQTSVVIIMTASMLPIRIFGFAIIAWNFASMAAVSPPSKSPRTMQMK